MKQPKDIGKVIRVLHKPTGVRARLVGIEPIFNSDGVVVGSMPILSWPEHLQRYRKYPTTVAWKDIKRLGYEKREPIGKPK